MREIKLERSRKPFGRLQVSLFQKQLFLHQLTHKIVHGITMKTTSADHGQNNVLRL